MKLGIDVDMTLKAENSYLNVPVIPTSISYADGDATPVTVSILQLGEIDFYNGVALDTLSWSCFFPARYDAGYCKSASLLIPTAYRNKLSEWKDHGVAMQVIIPSAGINKTMKIASFKWEMKGFEGDIYYSITLKEHRTVKPIQVSAKKIVIQSAREPLEPSESKAARITIFGEGAAPQAEVFTRCADKSQAGIFWAIAHEMYNVGSHAIAYCKADFTNHVKIKIDYTVHTVPTYGYLKVGFSRNDFGSCVIPGLGPVLEFGKSTQWVQGANTLELDVSQLSGIYEDLGADGFSFSPIIGFGPTGADPHGTPGDRKVKAGDAIILDIG
ncbi:MAG: M24 family metallopeptidase, partial [Clostridia bacterium]